MPRAKSGNIKRLTPQALRMTDKDSGLTEELVATGHHLISLLNNGFHLLASQSCPKITIISAVSL